MTVEDDVSPPAVGAVGRRRPETVRIAVRAVLAVAVAAGACDLAWRAVPHRLSVTTDIVGFPIFYHFDPNRYFDAFYLIAIAFPFLAIALYTFVPLGRGRGPRVPRTPIRPIPLVDPDHEAISDHALTAGRGVTAEPRGVALARRGARLALPAFAVGVCVGVIAAGGGPTLSPWGVVAGVAYVAVVVAVSRAGRARSVERAALAPAVNGGAALVVVPLLYFVARSSSVLVQSDHRLHRYPWLPLWLVVPVFVALCLWYRHRLRPVPAVGASLDGPNGLSRPRAEGAETAVLTYVVGATLLLVLVAQLASPLDTTFAAFDQAQSLASAQLTFAHGLFPWRDLYFIHGVFGDVLAGQLGMSVFAPNRWGSASGFTIFLVPMLWLSVYVFAAYFARRNRLFAAGVVAVAVLWLTGGRLAGVGLLLGRDVMGYAEGLFRFAFLPLVLVLLDQTIRRRSRAWCAGLGAALVVQAIVVPETALMAAGILATLVAFEWLGRARGAPWAGTLFRTWWCVATGALFVAGWVVFLAATGALRGFVDYYLIFGPGHTLSGAKNAFWIGKQLDTTVEFIVPVVLLLLTILRVTVQVRRRQPWSRRDWIMVAAASYVLVYYQKVLARADPIHVAEVFVVTVPLLVLWLMTAVEALDGGLRRLGAAHPGRRAGPGSAVRRVLAGVRHPVTLVALVALVALAPAPLGPVRAVAAHYHLRTAREPVLDRLGYSDPGVIDTTMVRDLGTVLDRYAGTDGAVFDFNDEPGLLYYLLDRVPGTRYYNVSMADTGFAQRQLISDLTRSRPRVVVFYGQDIGLPAWDGIEPTVRHYDVSQFLLDHYAPLADVDGQLVMIRDDLAASAPPLPPLIGHATSQDLYLSNPQCAWGFSPNFLVRPTPVPSQPAVTATARLVANSTLQLAGWTRDRRPGQSPLPVLAARDGQVVGTVVPNLYHTASSPGSEFTMALPVTAAPGPVSLYSENPDGTVSPIIPKATVSGALVITGRATTVTTSDGRVHTVRARRGGELTSAAVSANRLIALDLPPGTDLAHYRWLELSAPAVGAGPGGYSLIDGIDQSPNLVTFSTLLRAPTHLFVRVGSCPQWRGFSAPGLSLVVHGGPRSLPSVRLVG